VSHAAESLQQHLERPLGRGHLPADAHTGAAGGAACGDLVRISLELERHSASGRIADAGFDASGCGAVLAAGSAVVGLIRGVPLLDAARIGAERIAAELGGLSPAKRHAAELAADALHRALGWAAREQAALAPSDSRTLVAMSGGVDSAVAALLVARQGAEAVGVTLELWSDPENDGEASCCSAQAVRGARELAHQLAMPHLSIDLRAEFRAGVVEHWLADHGAGLTPNPCVRCNGSVRLDAMLELGERLGARTLATGHYARVERDGGGAGRGGAGRGGAEGRGQGAAEQENGARVALRMAADVAKDQSYVLSALAPASLRRLRFPLGELRKEDVRALAAEAGLGVARKPDSQDLCFLAGTRHGDFLQRHAGLGLRPGPIVDRQGAVLGEHRGAHAYTVGQRPLYVLATDAAANTVTVGPREALLCASLPVSGLTLHRDGACVDGVRVRSHGRRFACHVPSELRAGRHAQASIALAEPAERTAPGQIACLYAGELVVGYGTIAR
jgi:tRNA-uridine 2-sulfurtransferase